MKQLFIGLFALLMVSCKTSDSIPEEEITDTTINHVIPAAGNSWSIDPNNDLNSTRNVNNEGVRDWTSNNITIVTYLYIKEPTTINIGIRASTDQGTSSLNVIFDDITVPVEIVSNNMDDYFIGQFEIEEKGYYPVSLGGVNKQGNVYADIDAILYGLAGEDQVGFIKDENEYYWARRGASVHLWYDLPSNSENIEWFYSELTVPEGSDVIGSYFMTNGFGEGYFGIQVNSNAERKVLFSVWSPYNTDDPSQVPDDYKVQLIDAGDDVITGTFGNEGTGGQSFMSYNWETDTPYSFLIGVEPNSNNNETMYKAYFKPSNSNEWMLLAKFVRPKTNTYLRGIYSFLENFIPSTGIRDRQGHYHNQWYFSNGTWKESTQARFTADNTARIENRFDYSGGAVQNYYFLRNNGFTNHNTDIDSNFSRASSGQSPNIDFNKLK